jgi:hypothetical protein
MNRLGHSVRPSRQHRAKDLLPPELTPLIQFFDFSSILRLWGSSEGGNHSVDLVYASTLLEQTQKVSIAVSLAYCGAVLRDAHNCCGQFAYNATQDHPKRHIVLSIRPHGRLAIGATKVECVGENETTGIY